MNKQQEDRQAYLGRGLAWPLRVNAKGELSLAGGADDIEQSIRIILGTRPGERMMRPEFGCAAHSLMFEPRDAATRVLMQRFVEQALGRWEPRIILRAVNVYYADDELDGGVFVEIEYQIKESHDVRSIVYPFFLADEESW